MGQQDEDKLKNDAELEGEETVEVKTAKASTAKKKAGVEKKGNDLLRERLTKQSEKNAEKQAEREQREGISNTIDRYFSEERPSLDTITKKIGVGTSTGTDKSRQAIEAEIETESKKLPTVMKKPGSPEAKKLLQHIENLRERLIQVGMPEAGVKREMSIALTGWKRTLLDVVAKDDTLSQYYSQPNSKLNIDRVRYSGDKEVFGFLDKEVDKVIAAKEKKASPTDKERAFNLHALVQTEKEEETARWYIYDLCKRIEEEAEKQPSGRPAGNEQLLARLRETWKYLTDKKNKTLIDDKTLAAYLDTEEQIVKTLDRVGEKAPEGFVGEAVEKLKDPLWRELLYRPRDLRARREAETIYKREYPHIKNPLGEDIMRLQDRYVGIRMKMEDLLKARLKNSESEQEEREATDLIKKALAQLGNLLEARTQTQFEKIRSEMRGETHINDSVGKFVGKIINTLSSQQKQQSGGKDKTIGQLSPRKKEVITQIFDIYNKKGVEMTGEGLDVSAFCDPGFDGWQSALKQLVIREPDDDFYRPGELDELESKTLGRLAESFTKGISMSEDPMKFLAAVQSPAFRDRQEALKRTINEAKEMRQIKWQGTIVEPRFEREWGGGQKWGDVYYVNQDLFDRKKIPNFLAFYDFIHKGKDARDMNK